MSVTPSAAASSGSAARTRPTSSSTAASMAAPAGSARVPMSRQRPPTRPISAIEAVAAPWSMVEERMRVGGHRQMLPGPPRTRWSGVPGELFVELLEASDQQLDARVVGHDLAGGRQVPTEDATEHRVEEQHRVGAERRDTAGWPRGNARPRTSGRAAGSRGRPVSTSSSRCSSLGSIAKLIGGVPPGRRGVGRDRRRARPRTPRRRRRPAGRR